MAKTNIRPNHDISFIWRKPLSHLFAEVDASSVVLFRICFGFIMLVEVFRYFDHNWISKYWIEATYNFPYWPFDFLEPLSGDGMIYLFIAMGILSVCIMLGLFYRMSMLLFFLGFTYMFLLEQTRYLNHFYLIVLLSLVMIFIPAHKHFSLDAKLFKRIASPKIPLWALWLLRFMIGVPYFFGGIAKINPDWLAGQPLGIWLGNDTDFPILGNFFHEKWMIMLISYSGLFLDLLLVPLLLFKRTRIWAFTAGLLFHLMNVELFEIGIFPWFMIASTTLFFAPDWPKRMVDAINGNFKKTYEKNTFVAKALNSSQKRIVMALGIWCAIMIFVPLRHLVIPGNASWTEAGHKFAWHMKLRTKRAKGNFIVKAKDGSFTKTRNMKKDMRSWQYRKAQARPPIIWQYAQYIKEEYAEKGQEVSVFADMEAKLNGRPYQQFTDPNVDLASEPYPVWNPSWILPLDTPLPDIWED